MNRLLRRPVVQAGLSWLLGCYLDFALRTTRWKFEGREHVLPHAAGQPVIVAFWHERLPLMPMLWVLSRRLPGASPRRAYVLVSKHRDGQFIGSVIRRFGIDVVSGSTTRGGIGGVRRLLTLLKRGDHISITPDGPRGPRRQVAPGVAQIAAFSGAPVLPCAAQTSRRWVLKTWDQMVIPKPFGQGVVVCGPAIPIARTGWEQAVGRIGIALTVAAEAADRMVGS